ncbi:hypothetical protein BC830DRAFT_65229 [Chytriomyces sp. MP71]|nr:hypothetical protein BC830DRAFT_65229 [Chytriomyces sp. MP71]
MPTTSDLACLQQSSTSNTLKPAREPKKSKPLASLRRTPTQISDAVSETVSNNGGDFSSPVTGRREGLRVKPKRKYNESDPEDEDWDDPKNLIPQKTKPTVIAKTEDATTQVADRPVWRYGAPQVQPPPLPHSSEPHFVPQLGFQGSRMSPLPPTHYYYNVQDGSQAPHNYHARPQKDFPSEGSQHPYYSSNGPPQGYNTPPHHQPSPQPHYPSSQLQSHNFPTPPQLLSGNPLPPKPYFVNHPQTQSFPFPHQLYLSPVTLPPSQNSPQNSIAGHPSMQQPIQHYSSMHSHYTIQQPHYFVSYSGYPNARPSPQCSEAQYSAWPGWRPNHQTNPAAPAHMMQSVPRRSPLLPPPHRIQSLSHYSPVHPPHTMQPVPASPQTPSNEFVNSQESRKVVSRDGLDALAAVCRWEKAA